jgi:hypothetical protein
MIQGISLTALGQPQEGLKLLVKGPTVLTETFTARHMY